MAFDPDAYLAQAPAPAAAPFDPDAYLATPVAQAAAFDPDAYLASAPAAPAPVADEPYVDIAERDFARNVDLLKKRGQLSPAVLNALAVAGHPAGVAAIPNIPAVREEDREARRDAAESAAINPLTWVRDADERLERYSAGALGKALQGLATADDELTLATRRMFNRRQMVEGLPDITDAAGNIIARGTPKREETREEFLARQREEHNLLGPDAFNRALRGSGEFMEEAAISQTRPDPSRDESLTDKSMQVIGGMAPVIATAPISLPVGAIIAGGQGGEESLRQSRELGLSPEETRRRFALNFGGNAALTFTPNVLAGPTSRVVSKVLPNASPLTLRGVQAVATGAEGATANALGDIGLQYFEDGTIDWERTRQAAALGGALGFAFGGLNEPPALPAPKIDRSKGPAFRRRGTAGPVVDADFTQPQPLALENGASPGEAPLLPTLTLDQARRQLALENGTPRETGPLALDNGGTAESQSPALATPAPASDVLPRNLPRVIPLRYGYLGAMVGTPEMQYQVQYPGEERGLTMTARDLVARGLPVPETPPGMIEEGQAAIDAGLAGADMPPAGEALAAADETPEQGESQSDGIPENPTPEQLAEYERLVENGAREEELERAEEFLVADVNEVMGYTEDHPFYNLSQQEKFNLASPEQVQAVHARQWARVQRRLQERAVEGARARAQAPAAPELPAAPQPLAVATPPPVRPAAPAPLAVVPPVEPPAQPNRPKSKKLIQLEKQEAKPKKVSARMKRYNELVEAEKQSMGGEVIPIERLRMIWESTRGPRKPKGVKYPVPDRAVPEGTAPTGPLASIENPQGFEPASVETAVNLMAPEIAKVAAMTPEEAFGYHNGFVYNLTKGLLDGNGNPLPEHLRDLQGLQQLAEAEAAGQGGVPGINATEILNRANDVYTQAFLARPAEAPLDTAALPPPASGDAAAGPTGEPILDQQERAGTDVVGPQAEAGGGDSTLGGGQAQAPQGTQGGQALALASRTPTQPLTLAGRGTPPPGTGVGPVLAGAGGGGGGATRVPPGWGAPRGGGGGGWVPPGAGAVGVPPPAGPQGRIPVPQSLYTNGLEKIWAELKEKFVDTFSDLEDTHRKFEKLPGARQHGPNETISNFIDRVIAAPRLAGQFVKDTGYADMLMNLEDPKEFGQLLIDLHSFGLAANNHKTGVNPQAAAARIAAVGPKYRNEVATVQNASKALLGLAVQYGLISPEAATMLNDLYPHYVPFERVFEAWENKENGASRKAVASLSKQSAIREFEGSNRPIENPLGSILKKTEDVFVQGERNNTAKMLAEFRHEPGWSDIIREVPPGVHPKNTFSYLDEGVKRTFEAPEEIVTAAKNLNSTQMSTLMQAFTVPMRLFKTTTTGIAPVFISRNVVRDAITTGVQSPNAMDALLSVPKALFAALGHGPLYEEAVRAAGVQTSWDLLRNEPMKTVEQIRSGKDVKSKVKYIVAHPTELPGELLRGIENIVGRGEEFGRMVNYLGGKRAALRQGASPEEATTIGAQQARNTTANFPRVGTWSRVLNAMIPFWSAGIAATRSFWRAARDRPKMTALKLAAGVITPVAVATLWNTQDEEMKAAWDDIPEYEKENNIILLPPNPKKDAKGRWNAFKIPLPPGVGRMANIVRRPIEQMRGQDPVAADEMMQALVAPFTPIEPDSGGFLSTMTPLPAKPLIEASPGINKNFFTLAKVVPDRLTTKPNEFQKDEETSNVAIQIGKITGWSPMRIDHVMFGYTSEVGREVVNAIDNATARFAGTTAIGGRSVPEGYKRSFASAAGGETSRRYYIANQAAQQAQAGFREYLKQGNPAAATQFYRENKTLIDAAYPLNAINSRLKNINRLMVGTPPDSPKMEQLRRDQDRIAREGVELVRKLNVRNAKNTEKSKKEIEILPGPKPGDVLYNADAPAPPKRRVIPFKEIPLRK